MTGSLFVWWDGIVAGALQVNQHGQQRFAYTNEWLGDLSRPAISVSLPKRPEPFKQRECRPFFAGLLPEASQRDAIAAALGISKGNDFALLDALGGDVAGALSLWPEGVVPPEHDPAARATPIDGDELVRLLDVLPVRPMLAGQTGLRLSLAGAQSKLPVVLVDGRVALPARGQATTHILKPPIARFPNTTENEAFVMTLAGTLGLPVAPVEARVVSGRSYLLVTRYDRRADQDGRVHRLHQEDFCQALGIPPEQKYAAEGGPTFKVSFELLRRVTTRPAIAVLALLDAAIFNVIAGNADAHGKNFSVLYEERGLGLAPFYDLLATVAYPELAPAFAMTIARRGSIEQIGTSAWSAFARDAGLTTPFVLRRVRELADAVIESAPPVAAKIAREGLSSQALETYASLVTSRAERMLKATTT